MAYDLILEMSRQNNIGELTPWFQTQLKALIENGTYPSEETIRDEIMPKIIEQLRLYAEQTGRNTVVIGMSGGVDSALTAALFKAAGWRVIGVTMPINQVQDETDRGIEACNSLGIEHKHVDLSSLFDITQATLYGLDGALVLNDRAARIRKGNMRARLRMITLYNLASAENGLVASTDNLSELTAGFWTLHGDVGDLSPIQSLSKSWEVPMMAKLIGVPESTWRATPTDGLGIDAGDEAQLGASYLEWDIMFFSAGSAAAETFEDGSREAAVESAVFDRMAMTWFKRMNPVNIEHPMHNRFDYLEGLDNLVRPAMFRK